jgi:phosphoglycolate phosphatase-like HAD superfamily hydrolase
MAGVNYTFIPFLFHGGRRGEFCYNSNMFAVLFDIDGTLVASGGAGKAALEAAFTEEFGITLSAAVPYAGRTDRAIARDLLRLHGVEDSSENWHKLQAAYLTRLPDRLHRHNGRVLPGIAALLAELGKREDVVLGLLTGNIRAGARVKLGHYGLFDYFAFGGFGDRHFDRDDVAREALSETMAHLDGKGSPERIWVIGDTPLDVRCARAIGAKVVAVATGMHSHEQLRECDADLTFPDLSDFAPLLDRLG